LLTALLSKMARLSLQHVLLASTMCPLGHGQTIVGQDGRVIGSSTPE
jgi:hypothetical protein